jgi:enoyl-CoA hydratase
VVTGAADRAFCSGADLKDIEAVMARAAGGRGAPLGFADLEPGKPRIAAVEGWRIAGGIDLGEGVRRFAERTGEDGASGPLHP